MNLKPKIILASMLLMSIVSCKTTKTVPVEIIKTTVNHDSLIMNHQLYDSIYIQNNRTQEFHLNPLNLSNHLNPDTLLIKETSVEYHYKLLRDTIYKSKTDTVMVVKQAPSLWGRAGGEAVWIGAICLLLIAILVAIKLTKH